MQSETADCAPGAATWRTERNIYALSLIVVHPLRYVKNDVIHRTGSRLDLHQRRKKTAPQPLVRCTENLEKFGRAGFERRERTDRQTDRQTEMLITELHIPRSKVT